MREDLQAHDWVRWDWSSGYGVVMGTDPAVTGTYRDLSLEMIHKARQISGLTPSAGDRRWYGGFATGIDSLSKTVLFA